MQHFRKTEEEKYWTRTTETRSVLLGYAPHGALADRPTLLAHDPPSCFLPAVISLARSHSSSRCSVFVPLSVPFQHADLPSARYEARVSSSEFNRRDHTAIQWIPFPRCPSGWSNALNYSLALPHVLHNRRKILIDPFFLLKSYQCIYIYIYLNRIIFCHSFEWNIYHCYNNRNILNQIVSFFFNFDIEIFKPCHDLKKKLRNIR